MLHLWRLRNGILLVIIIKLRSIVTLHRIVIQAYTHEAVLWLCIELFIIHAYKLRSIVTPHRIIYYSCVQITQYCDSASNYLLFMHTNYAALWLRIELYIIHAYKLRSILTPHRIIYYSCVQITQHCDSASNYLLFMRTNYAVLWLRIEYNIVI